MKKARKVVRIVLLAVVILIVVVAAAIRLFADRAVKMGIETAGSKALNVGVKVQDVDLSILGGSIGFQNLAIDNPPGYQQEKLLELKDAYIAVNVKSLLSDVVNIEDIKLVGANLVVEQKGISSNNLRDIMKSIPAKKEQQEPSGKKLHIDNLELSEVTVRVNLLPVSGKSDTVTLKLKHIKMTDLGGDNELDVAGLSRKILLALAGGIAEQGEGVLPDEIIGSLSDQLKRLGALSGAWLDEGGRILKEGTDLGKDIAEGLTGLFKSKEKKEEEQAP
ncbi:MAG: DUF748 domain-containing protein [Planctomycetota bacterium]|jgi:uncharacterized protein involved in outer membrane biogenesis